MPPILLSWPTRSEAYVGGMAVRMNFHTNIVLHFVAMCQMIAEGQSDKLTSDMEVHLKQ